MAPPSQQSAASGEKQPLLGQYSLVPGSEKHSRVNMSTKRMVCYGILMVVALAFVLSALLLLPFAMAEIYKWVINKMMVLDPSSPLFAEWATPDIPMFQSFYFFEIQNPEEFKGGGKPSVIERGPYVYRLEFTRVNMTFYDNGTLSHRPEYFYFFDEEKSVGPESDRIITLNMPLVTIAYFVKDSGFIIQDAVNLLLENFDERLTLNLTVLELLWGYDEPIFKLIQPIITIPGFDDGKFGFLLGFNGTTNDQYTVFTGKENQSLLNVVDNYQGEPTLSWWWSDEANSIRGTDGTMYHPYMTRAEDIYLFHPDLCRSIPYIYQNDTIYKKVPLLKFVLASYAYDNGTDYPPNAGFCKGKKELCGPSGIMRQDPCRFGSPSAISNPHFFQGDPSLYEAVDGLDPQAKYHQHYIEIEPLMGMPYVLKMRLQISMKLERVKNIKEVEHVRDMVMPVLWFEQSVEADDRIVGYYETGFVLTAYIAMIIKWVVFSIGIVMFVVTIFFFGKRIARPEVVAAQEKFAGIINECHENGSCDQEA